MSAFWTIVFAVGAAQGVFLCGALLLRRSGNGTVTRLLAALVSVATTMIVVGALTETLPEPYGLLLIFLNINTELAIGPLLLLFARSLVDPERRLTRADSLHFAAIAAGMLAWAMAWAVLGNTASRLEFLDGPAVPLYMLCKMAWLFGYVTATYRALSCDEKGSRIHVAGRRPIRLSWLRHAVLLMAGLAGTIYLSDFSTRFGLPLPFDADPYGSLILAVMIYLASLMVLQRPWVLDLRLRPAPDDSLGDDVAALTTHLESERPWLRPDLALGDLAGELGWTENRLSAVIGEGMGTTFYTLLNRLRLAEFERLARDPGRRDRSVLELAYGAGFNSKASFYRVFRASHGTTPTAFRKAI